MLLGLFCIVCLCEKSQACHVGNAVEATLKKNILSQRVAAKALFVCANMQTIQETAAVVAAERTRGELKVPRA